MSDIVAPPALLSPLAGSRAPLIELLLRHGADINAHINAQDPLGRTALHWAARVNALRVARELVKQGVDLEARDGAGMTALFLAATHGKAKSVEVLLELGANPSAVNAFGQTLDDCIELYGVRKVIADHEQSARAGCAGSSPGKITASKGK